MSLRDFLLDYAEKAPKTPRWVGPTKLRFEGFVCPLELSAGVDMGCNAEAAAFYGLSEEEMCLITIASDNPRREPYREWRAILEKLAEPEVAS